MNDSSIDQKFTQAIGEMQRIFFEEETKYAALSASLRTLLQATDSQCGFLAEMINSNESASLLRTCCVCDTESSYHPARRIMYLPTLQHLFGTEIQNGHTSTGEFSHITALFPMQHNTIDGNSAYLAVPMIEKNRLTGIVVVVGRRGGYPEKWQKAAKALFSSLHLTLAHYQNLRKHFLEKYALRRAQNVLLSTLRHEIRTPINGVLGLCDLLQDTELTSQQEHFVKGILRASTTLLGTVNDALKHPKLRVGRIEVHEQMFDLVQLIEDLITVLDPARADKGIELSLLFPPDMQRHYFGDAAKIRHIISNLLSNAIKYTHNGSVRIKISNSIAGEIEIIVQDTGVGMDPELIVDVFQMNHKAKGLGLLINRTLAQQLGGDIEIRSSREIGSEFTLRLPLQSPNAPVNAEQAMFEPQHFSEKRILLVEDDPINQNITVFSLAKLGCQVDVAADGFEALEMYKSRYYDLILMDCRMPRMDGYESTRKIRDLEAMQGKKRVPIVAVTANDLPENRDKCLEVGMDDYLPKPVQLSVMRNVVQMYLNRNQDIGQSITPNGRLDQPNLQILADMLGDDKSLIHRVLKRYRLVLTEQLDFLQARGALLNKKEFSKYVEIMKGSAAYSGYTNFAAHLAALESSINNSSVVPSQQVVNELIRVIESMLRGTKTRLVNREVA